MDATDWDARYAEVPLMWSSRPNQFVEAELADLPPGHAVDVACGEGRNARWLAARGWRVTALDFSHVAIERARELDTEGAVRWVVADALTAPLPEADLVLLAYLQLPADQRRTAVRRAFETLRPGGTLLVIAHDPVNLERGTGGPQEPAVLYSAQDVLDDLDDLDDLDGMAYHVVKAELVTRDVERDDGTVAQAFDSLVLVQASRG
jgi:SAM-dependent methyltransferase